MNEACLNAKWIGEDLSGEKAQNFTKDILNRMRERLSDYQEEYGDLHNLEATPAESTTYRLAKSDKDKYPGIITAAISDKDTPYYTNSSHLPVGYTEDIFSALDIQDNLQTLYTSGTVFHAFLGERLPTWQSTAALVRKIAENYKLPYYTISPTYSICQTHGYINGEVPDCPECGVKTEVYSRITGYYRPVQNWNDGKAQEFKDRKQYDVNPSELVYNGSSQLPVVSLSEDSNSATPVNPLITANPIETVTYATPANTVTNVSTLNHVVAVASEPPTPQQPENGYTEALLFTTKKCANCPTARGYLDGSSIMYKVVDAEENKELARKYRVMQAPTLVVVNGEDVMSYANTSNIRKYAESHHAN
jgi:ribonucleoside-triphosphate reductase